MLLNSRREDPYGLLCVLVLALVRTHSLPGAALSPVLAPSLPSPLKSRSSASHGPPSPAPPRTPRDCPVCCLSSTFSAVVGPSPLPVRPWREVKSRRGAPKRVNTEGFACPNHQCPYFGITDALIHALVGDGTHGQVEQIQTFRGPACHTTFSARRHTPLYRLKTPSRQVAMVLTARASGLDPSEAPRVFGYRQATITTWLTRAGSHAQTLHERCFCNLWLPHLQLDELRTRLRSYKQVRLSLAGHRPHHEDSSRTPAGTPHAKCGASTHPLPATALGPRLPADLHQ